MVGTCALCGAPAGMPCETECQRDYERGPLWQAMAQQDKCTLIGHDWHAYGACDAERKSVVGVDNVVGDDIDS